MPKASKGAFYGVKVGRTPGVYTTWDDCEAQVLGFPGAKHRKFTNAADAETYVGPISKASSSKSAQSYEATTTVPAVINHTSKVITPYSKPPSKGDSSSTSTAASASASSSRVKNKRTPDSIHDEKECIVVYSDGSCRGNGKVGSFAGVGVWWGRNDRRNLAERCPGTQTNNRAELIAIVRVLETAPREKTPILIKTDSQYSIKCFREWIHKWRTNNWLGSKGEPVKNASIIRYISALLDERGNAGQKVRLEHVKGHAGEEGNEGADQLANQGAMMAEVPDRDWDALEQEVFKRTRAAATANTSVSAAADEEEDLDLEAYAEGLLDPEDLERELMEDEM